MLSMQAVPIEPIDVIRCSGCASPVEVRERHQIDVGSRNSRSSKIPMSTEAVRGLSSILDDRRGHPDGRLEIANVPMRRERLVSTASTPPRALRGARTKEEEYPQQSMTSAVEAGKDHASPSRERYHDHMMNPGSWEYLQLETYYSLRTVEARLTAPDGTKTDRKDVNEAEQLNALGAEGWELVSVQTAISAHNGIDSNYLRWYYFKRPLR